MLQGADTGRFDVRLDVWGKKQKINQVYYPDIDEYSSLSHSVASLN